MKKIFLMAAVAVMAAMTATGASAQTKGDMAAGVKLAGLSDNGFETIGLGVRFQYNALDNLRLEPSFTYFLPRKIGGYNNSFMDLSANAHWLFRAGRKVNIYPLAGVGVLTYRNSGHGYTSSESIFTANLGAGVDFFVSNRSFLNVEAKLMIRHGSTAILSAGYGFLF